MRLNKFYIAAVLLALFLTVLAVAPGLGLINLIFAAIFWFAPVTLLYLLCLAPFFILWRRFRRPRTGLVASLAAVGVVGWIAPIVDVPLAQARLANIEAQEVRTERRISVRSMELTSTRIGCNNLCRAVLYSGQLDWVRITNRANPEIGERVGNPDESTLLVIGEGDQCAVPIIQRTPPKRCLVFQPDHDRPADLLVRYETDVAGKDQALRWLAPWRVRRANRLTITHRGSETDDIVWLQRRLVFDAITAPAFFFPNLVEYDVRGVTFRTRTAAFTGSISLEDPLQKLGFNTSTDPIPAGADVPDSDSPPRPLTDHESILAWSAMSGDAPLTRVRYRAAMAWAYGVHSVGSRTPAQTTFLHQVENKIRHFSLPAYQRTMRVAPTGSLQRPAPIPEMIEAFLSEEAIQEDREAASRELDRRLREVELEMLAPYRESILAKVRGDARHRKDPVLAAFATALGEHPQNWPADVPKLGKDRIRALCTYRPLGDPEIINLLIAEIERSPPRNNRRLDPMLMLALVMNTDRAFVDSLFADRGWPVIDPLRYRSNEISVFQRSPFRYCR